MERKFGQMVHILSDCWQNTCWRGQDGRAGRPWAYLLLHTPKLQLFTEQQWIRKAWRLAEKVFSYKYKEGTSVRWVGEAEISIVKTYIPRWATRRQEDNYNCRDAYQGPRGSKPQTPQPGSPAAGRWAPRVFEGQWRLLQVMSHGQNFLGFFFKLPSLWYFDLLPRKLFHCLLGLPWWLRQ